ncbi:hypothetical protein GF366_01360, partial [Candidatus Peregrinibacteria bacterium]|nr:hypothetical protein [Candidatus Peregrinibacteria bacterium]
MPKKLKDLKIDPKSKKINLQGKDSKKKKPIEKEENILYKQKSPIKEVRDINGGKEGGYLYIKGKNFKPPKFLGNLLKIGLIGFLIIMLINAVNVYFIGKGIEKDISETAYEGYNFLLDAGKSATKIQFENALTEFNKALKNFERAEEELWFINTDYTFYSKSSDIEKAVIALLEGGKYFATAGKYFLEAVEEFNKIPIYFVSKNIPTNKENVSITDTLKAGLEKTDLAIEQISLAAEE